jgi:Mlc titration factor MtfA (ptsG expression regulator)
MRIVRRSTLYTTGLLAMVVGGGVALAASRVDPMWTGVGLVPVLLILGLGLRRPLRRWHTARAPMPGEWHAWLQAHIPLYDRLDPAARDRFERDVRFAMDEYTFEGVDDVAVTDRLRLSVAAGIALLLHGRPSWELPGRRSVLFYPDRFNDTYYDSRDAAYDGMVHEQGPILLSAPSVRRSWADPADADNVVLHELAHLFDFENEGPDGVPSLVAAASEESWQSLVRREMGRVQRGDSILRPYAAEAPSEFFAVAVEAFFEQPARMARRHEELFAALVAFFHLDPRTGQQTDRPVPAGRTAETGAEV